MNEKIRQAVDAIDLNYPDAEIFEIQLSGELDFLKIIVFAYYLNTWFFIKYYPSTGKLQEYEPDENHIGHPRKLSTP